MALDVRAVSSLYGGFWNFEIQDFCYMTNQYFPPDEFIESLSSRLRTLVKSYPSTNSHLSSLIAEPLGMGRQEVVVANGASELISVISSLYFEHLAIPTPTFDEYINRAHVQGKRVSPYAMEMDFRLDVDGFIAHVRETRANSVVVVRPNNPSGTLVSKEETVRMLRAFSSLDMVVIDESFLYFADSDDADPSVAGMIHEFPNMVILNSLSKAYGVPGLRLGYAASGNQRVTASLRANLPIWSINSLAQFFLESMVAYRTQFSDSCVQVRRATQALYQGLRTVPILEPYPTQGNYVLCRTSHGFTGSELTALLFEKHGVLINDCGAKRGLDNQFVRIASRTAEENDGLVRTLHVIANEIPSPEGARR
jgi:threonine-phosphate decarboxylase